ncbi:MAG: hypothetical protein Q4B60_05670 [Erysipelotrichaceae bacterium]|nr:hypothetical protein [Erysipelotrichaceae bacterium]
MVKNSKFALILNATVVALAVAGIVLNKNDLSPLNLSNTANYLALVASLLFVVMIVSKKEQKELPFFVPALRFASTVLLVINLLVTVLNSALNGDFASFMNAGLLMNLVNPIISFVSFILFEADRRLNKKTTIWFGMIPVLVYFTLITVMVMASKLSSPYSFINGTSLDVAYLVAIIVVAYIVCRFTLIQNQKHTPRRVRKA